MPAEVDRLGCEGDFAAQAERESDYLAECDYGRHCAEVQRGNVVAAQFYSERSGVVGLKVVKVFCSL